MDCLLKENGELKTKGEEGEALRKEMDELRNQITAIEEIRVRSRQPDPLLQEPISDINTEDIASLRSRAEAGPGNLTSPTIRTGTNIPSTLSTPGTVSQELQRRQEERMKRKAEESINESSSSEEEEEDEPISLDFDDEEYQGSETPSQFDPVDELEMRPFKVNRPSKEASCSSQTQGGSEVGDRQ